MTAIEKIKHELIDQILLVRDEELLAEINYILKTKNTDKVMHLNEPQIEMLKMSERDIENGDVISQDDLNERDLEWLK